jgi:uncharacterized protein
MPLTTDAEIRDLLLSARTIAMVGASPKPDRPSHGVMEKLQQQGYRVIPVNATIPGEHILGEYVFDRLDQIGVPIDIVDIFRNSEAAGESVEAAGLKVVMNRCPKAEINRLGLPPVGAPQKT